MLIGYFANAKAALPNEVPQHFVGTVNKFRAQFEGHKPIAARDRQDTAADAVARFKNFHLRARLRQFIRRRKSSRASADDQHIRHTHYNVRWTRARRNRHKSPCYSDPGD